MVLNHLLHFSFLYSMEGGELFSRIQEKQNFNEQGTNKQYLLLTLCKYITVYFYINEMIKLETRRSRECENITENLQKPFRMYRCVFSHTYMTQKF